MTHRAAHAVLVVDNDPLMIASLEARLRGQGLRCVSALSGLDASATFEACSPDLIITDLNMPHGSGEMLLEWTRQRSDVPIILISGYRHAHRNASLYRNTYFLHKPFEARDLLEIVRHALAEDDTMPAPSPRTT